MNIKELRELSGLTQWELAQQSRINRMRIRLTECGQLELRSDEDRAVRKVLLGVIEFRAAQIKRVLSSREPVTV